MKILKISIFLAGFVLVGFTFAKFSFLAGLFATLFCGMAIVTLLTTIDNFSRLKVYEKRKNHIYVVTRHPDTGQEPPGLTNLYKYIVFCDHDKAIKTKNKQVQLLTKSGNPLFDPGVTPDKKNRIKVEAFIFQDGGFDCETFSEDFVLRVRETITKEVQEFNARMKKANEDWYHKFGNNQSI